MKFNSSQYTTEGLIPGLSAFCFLSQKVIISTNDQFSDMVAPCITVSIRAATEAYCRSIKMLNLYHIVDSELL